MKINYGNFSDSQLIECLKKKDKNTNKAFAEIYSRYSQKLYSYCVRMLGNSEDAADCFQETFIKFYEKVGQKSETGSVLSYLIIIAKRLFLNKKRFDDRRFDFVDADWEEIEKSYNTEDHDPLEQKELEMILPEVLMKLSYPLREIVVLRLYQNLSYEEIEFITGTSYTLLRNRLMRAKEKLRKDLETYFKECNK